MNLFCIPMGTSCALLLIDPFLYSYKADFTQGVILEKREEINRIL